MKNFILKSCALLFILFFITTFAIRFIFKCFDSSLSDLILVSFINSVIFVGIYGLLIYFDMKPKIRFLTSSDTKLPRFGSKSQISFSVDSKLFSFEKLLSSINKVYIVDYENINEGILKFHTKMTMKQIQMGCFIQWDSKLSAISVYCFPFTGGFSSQATRKSEIFCENLKSEITIK